MGKYFPVFKLDPHGHVYLDLHISFNLTTHLGDFQIRPQNDDKVRNLSLTKELVSHLMGLTFDRIIYHSICEMCPLIL